MSEPYDLQLFLRRQTATHYALDLRSSQPTSEVDRLGIHGAAVTIDTVVLQAEQLDPDAYGRSLTKMIFASDAVVREFAACRAVAQSQAVALRLRLVLAPDAPELHALRWETLRDPETDHPLALSEQVVLTRTLSSADWQPVTLRAKGSLRALVVIAAPQGLERYGLAPLDVAAERRVVQDGLDGIATTVLAEPGEASMSTIVARLRDGYDILSITAHGILHEREPWLFLDDGQGNVTRVPGSDLVARLADLPTRPRLILLASCQSAGDGRHEALAALGPRLATAGVPAVIAMQGPITLATHARFAPAFFRELQRDGRIDRALAAARQTVAERQDWWVPALFTRLRSGRIWYEPGFDTQDFSRWPALLRMIERGKCTPILGMGVLERITGTSRELAQRLAERYNFPLSRITHDDLPQVAQYLAVKESVTFMREEVERELGQTVRKHMNGQAPALPEELPLTELIDKAWDTLRATCADEPHELLATLPLPIYLTATPDSLLAEALRRAGREAHVEVCPWHVEERRVDPSRGEITQPTRDHPLVYHLLGHLNEPESLVISEDDYFRYLIGVRANIRLIPPAVQRALTDTALLFLGFRFDDWSFRALLQSMLRLSGGQRRSQYAHVAVQIDPQEGVAPHPQAARQYLKDYFGPAAALNYQANISIYWGSTDDFIRELQQRWIEQQRKASPTYS